MNGFQNHVGRLPAWGLLGVAVYGAVLSFVLSFGETLSNSVDMGFHLQTVELLRDHLIFPSSAETFQREMFAYPRWSYRLAAPAAWAGLSSPNALGLAATGSLAAVWLILLATARRISAPTFIAAFLCASATTLFLGAAFGAEVIVNYFYPQLVGEPFALASILAGAYVIRRSKPAFLVLALIAIWVCGQFHLIAALRAAGGLAVVLLFDVASEWMAGRRRVAVWLLGLPGMALALLLNPAFAAMRKLSVVNGGIAFARPIEIWQLVLAAIALLGLSAAILLRQLRDETGDDPRRPAVTFFAALGASTASVALAQAAAFAWLGESSPYAVKKHAFGVFTALAFVIPIGAGLAWRSLSPALRQHAERPITILLAGASAAVALALARRMLAIQGVEAFPPFELVRYLLAAAAVAGLVWIALHLILRGWRPRGGVLAQAIAAVLVAHLAILELLLFRTGQMDAPRLSSLVEDSAAIRAAAPPEAKGFLFASSKSSVVVNFLVNMAALQLNRGSDRNYAAMLQTNDVPRPELAPYLITEVGDPTYDVPSCRRGPPVGSVVPVNGACVAEAAYDFGISGSGVPLLAEGWSANEPDFTWSDGPRAVVKVPLSPTLRHAQSPRMIIDTNGFVPTHSPRRTVHVSIDGGPPQTYTFDATISGDFTFRLDIPRETLRKGVATIVFKVDNPEIADPAAPRRLGVALRRIVIYPKAPPPQGAARPSDTAGSR